MGNATATVKDKEAADVLFAEDGSGPLYQRDYVGTIVGTDRAPEDVARLLFERIEDLAPPETAAFDSPKPKGVPVAVGDELTIRLGGAVPCKVRVVHIDPTTLTLRTLAGHPEAGRISFRSGRDDQGRLTFRIRSRARSAGPVRFVGWLLMGRAMQARCWIRFVAAVAEKAGGRLAGPVRVETHRVRDEAPDRRGGPDVPTFDDDDRG